MRKQSQIFLTSTNRSNREMSSSTTTPMLSSGSKTSTAQHRLLSAFDTERGRMQMAFLQAQVPHPKTVADYKKTSFEFDVKDVHPVDQMDMHRKT
jgi:hypothetical protein